MRGVDDLKALMADIGDSCVISDAAPVGCYGHTTAVTLLGRHMVVDIIDDHRTN